MSYRKIVQIGASGNIGTPVFESLLSSGKFDITVVARQSSTYTAPSASVKVINVDFSNHKELVEALRGNEAVVLTFGDNQNMDKNTKLVVDAAIEAGVKRVIPSGFGGDLANAPGRNELVLTPKHKVDDYLKEKSAEGAIEFTTIACGPFFDWGLTHHNFLGFDIPNHKATIYSGGNAPMNASTLETIGAAVVSVFSTPERFKNKHLRISDFYVTQNEILAILEKETGSKFEIQDVDVEKLQQDTDRGLAGGDWSQQNIYGSVVASVFATRGSARWGAEDDAASLGIQKKDLAAEIRKVL